MPGLRNFTAGVLEERLATDSAEPSGVSGERPIAAGRVESRRLGARGTTKFSVFLVVNEKRVRGRTVELSTTGVVLDFRHSERPNIHGLQTLELFVPGVNRPIRALARPVRRMGKLDAFEFLSIPEVDRLTLAEHLDRVRRLGF